MVGELNCRVPFCRMWDGEWSVDFFAMLQRPLPGVAGMAAVATRVAFLKCDSKDFAVSAHVAFLIAFNPAQANSARTCGQCSLMIARQISLALPPGTMYPQFIDATVWSEPFRVVMIGSPAAIASSSEFEVPSAREAVTKISLCLNRELILGRSS